MNAFLYKGLTLVKKNSFQQAKINFLKYVLLLLLKPGCQLPNAVLTVQVCDTETSSVQAATLRLNVAMKEEL